MTKLRKLWQFGIASIGVFSLLSLQCIPSFVILLLRIIKL